MPKPTNATAQLDLHPDLHNFHVDVKMFGAVGNGSTDDTAAFIAAKDAVVAAGGGTVFVPPTSTYYKVTTQATNHAIRIAGNGVSFVGAGYGSRIHNASVESTIFYVGDIDPGDTVVYTGITFANLRLTQTIPHTDDDFAAIAIRSAYGARVLNCDFDSIAEAISIHRRNVADAAPEACIIQGNRIVGDSNLKIGIEMMGTKGIICAGNTIRSTGTTGLGIRDVETTDSLITGNFVRGQLIGISEQARPAGDYLGVSNRPHIIGNRVVGVLGTARTAIQVGSSIFDGVIQNNYCEDFVNGIWLKADSSGGGTDDTVIKGNYLKTAAASSKGIFADAPQGSYNNTNVHVEDNHIDMSGVGTAGTAILLDTVDGRNYILGNHVLTSDAADGIQAVSIPAGTETTALWNVVSGVTVTQANDLLSTGSGKFVHWDHSGNTANALINTGGNDVLESIFTAAQITANQNDYDPLFGTGRQSAVWRLNTDASRNITGIAGGWQGRPLTIINIGSFNIVLQNQNVGSAAGNRIITGIAAPDLTLAPDDSATLIYDDTSARWRVVNSQIAGA